MRQAAANITELVTNLHTMSAPREGKSPQGLAADTRYQTALRAYFQGDLVTAADQASAYLAEEPDSSHRFASYRLWIEALAGQGDQASMTSLRDHLFVRGQAEPDDQPTYAALRGVVHFELDEFAAARLLARAFETAVDNPYGLELVQLVDHRLERTEVPALCRATSPVEDFFHWQTLSRGLLVRKQEEALIEVLGFVKQRFRTAPMPQVFEFHRSVEKGYYAAAAIMAEKLCEMYPDHVDYQFYHAYALFEDGDYPSARKILTAVVKKKGHVDAELVGLLGHCHAKLGEPEKAKEYLEAAQGLLQKDGLPSSHINLELANVEEELNGDAEAVTRIHEREQRSWLINLSPRRYHEMQTSSESTIEKLLRPMGKEPREGDFVFFAASEANALNEAPSPTARWKIVAVYTVDADPMWHPVHRWHSALRLVVRPKEGVPVEVQTAPEDHVGTRPVVGKDEPLAFGVYEMGQGALDVITEAIRQHNDGNRERRSGARAKGEVI